MSKKNIKSSRNTKSEKYLFYGTILGLIIGLIIGTIAFLLTDNIFWMTTPIIFLFFGLVLGSYLGRNKKSLKKHS